MRKFALASCLLLFLCAFARAGSTKSDLPTLTIWGPEVEKSLDTIGFDAEVAAFEKKYNCRVRRLNMGAGGMDPQKLSTAIAGRVPPTLVRQDRFTVGDWASRGAFQPLDDLIARDLKEPNGVRREDYYPACWDEAVYQGKVYAIPDTTDNRALYINRDFLRKAGMDPNRVPRDWDELREMALALTTRNKRGDLTKVGFMPIFGNVWLYMYSWQNGGEFMSPDGRTCTLNNPYTEEALKWIAGLYKDLGGLERVDAFNSTLRGAELDPFFIGKVGMKIDGNWFLSGIARYAPALDFVVVPAPVPSARLRGESRFAGQPTFITWSGGHSWVIPRGITGEDRELAWKFIKYDTSLEGQWINYTAQREAYRKVGRLNVPNMRANRKVTEALFKKFVPKRPRIQAAMKTFVDLMPNSKYRPVTFVGQRLWDEHTRAVDLALRGTPPAKALEMCEKAVQKELDKVHEREKYRVLPGWVYTALVSLAIGLPLLGLLWIALRMRKQGRNARIETIAAYSFAMPWIIGFLVFTLGPILMSVLLSFCDYDVLHPPRWLGLANYREIVNPKGDWPIVLKSFKNVMYMSVVGIPLTMLTGMAIAFLLNAKVKGMHWYRTAFYLPSIAPVVANAILWMWLFNPQYGIINHVWNATLAPWFGLTAPNWLSDEHWVKPAYILMGMWGAGSSMILWLAGLQGIPQHLYEAAELDGAGTLRQFWNVTIPMLTPTIFFLVIMGVIGSLQIFEIAYIMRGGGPLGYPNDATMMPVVLLFQNAFQYFKMGYASALAWILFIVILLITLFQLRLGNRWVHYGE